jgi:small redox-active disulfide protein 2
LKIKILGTGCAKCQQLEAVTREAVSELGIDATVEKVKDIVEIMEYPILTTPGLVINEKVVIAGKVPTREEVKILLEQAA